MLQSSGIELSSPGNNFKKRINKIQCKLQKYRAPFYGVIQTEGSLESTAGTANNFYLKVKIWNFIRGVKSLEPNRTIDTTVIFIFLIFFPCYSWTGPQIARASLGASPRKGKSPYSPVYCFLTSFMPFYGLVSTCQ